MNIYTSDLFWHRHSLRCPAALKPWLHDRGSLTRRIQQRCHQFHVEKTHSGLALIGRDEALLLQQHPRQLAYSRSVFLYADQQPVIFAHSCCAQTALPHWHAIRDLGSRPLGALLFADPAIQRASLSFQRLDQRHVLFQQAIQPLSRPPKQLWARRSVFYREHAKLLVTEVFLPEIGKL